MASTNAVFVAQDTVARSDTPTVNRGGASYLEVLGGGGAQRMPYLQAGTPAVVATVVNGKLRLRQRGVAAAGNRVLSLYRVTGKWREDQLTWNDKPARAATATATATVNGAGADGRIVEFDVTGDVQKFFDGTWANYGWRLESSNSNTIAFWSSEAATNVPELVVDWADTPEPPTDLEPSGAAVVALAHPLLRWSFIDLGGDTTLSAVQVHLKTANTGWSEAGGYTTPTFDSGVVAATESQLDLATTAYGGLTSGAAVWWTARHRDGAGLWSTWSDPETFSYLPHQAVTVPYPTTAIEDLAFPVRWTAADQVRYQVIVRRDGRTVWTTGAVASTGTRVVQIPRGALSDGFPVPPGTVYEVAVRVWDSQPRTAQPAAPAYVETTRTVTYTESSSVAGVKNLQITPEADRPAVELTWSRTAAPTQFAIWVDGREALVDTAGAFADGSTSYAYRVDGLAKNVTHTFQVKAIDQVTSGSDTFTRTSSANETVEGVVAPIGVWLIDPTDPDHPVRFLQEAGTTDIVATTMPEVTFTFEPVGATNTVAVTTALRAMEGTVTDGILADYGSLTAGELRARLLAMKSNRLAVYSLVWGSQSLEVRISDVNVVSTDDAPGVERYVASLAFAAAGPSADYALV